MNKFIIVGMIMLTILFVGVASATEDFNTTTDSVVVDDSIHRLSSPINQEITTNGGQSDNVSDDVAISGKVNQDLKEKLGMSDDADVSFENYLILTPGGGAIKMDLMMELSPETVNLKKC